jgi:ubiquinone/menaquinone biosynthesis C-methylase UbiE
MEEPMQGPSDAVDFEAITKKQQAVWATGDFHEIGRQVIQVSDDLCRAVDPHAGAKVLDVACGSGNAALVAARRYTEVYGIDYVPELIEHAKQRAAAEATKIDFRVADAQHLPFPDAMFDFVLSVFGVMFAPDRERAASELLRVCKPGGTIALACWTPGGFVGEFFKLQSGHAPPPPGVRPPVHWGTEDVLRELLGPGTAQIRAERRMSRQYYLSPQHAVHLFRTYFGPTVRAFQSLQPAEQEVFKSELEALFTRHNQATDGTLHVQSEYLQVLATRK